MKTKKIVGKNRIDFLRETPSRRPFGQPWFTTEIKSPFLHSKTRRKKKKSPCNLLILFNALKRLAGKNIFECSLFALNSVDFTTAFLFCLLLERLSAVIYGIGFWILMGLWDYGLAEMAPWTDVFTVYLYSKYCLFGVPLKYSSDHYQILMPKLLFLFFSTQANNISPNKSFPGFCTSLLSPFACGVSFLRSSSFSLPQLCSDFRHDFLATKRRVRT